MIFTFEQRLKNGKEKIIFILWEKVKCCKKRKEQSENLDEDEAATKREAIRDKVARSRAKMSKEKREDEHLKDRARKEITRLGHIKEYQKAQRSASSPVETLAPTKNASRARSVSKSIVKKVKNSAKRIIDPPMPPPSKKQQVRKIIT